MRREADDICPAPEAADERALEATRPMSPPIYLTSVWQCDDTQQAAALLSGELAGYVYQREAHPNADGLTAKCRELHGAERAVATGSGMAAMSVALLSQLQAGDHLIASSRLYGRSLQLLTQEAGRLGIRSSVVDTCDLDLVARACTADTRWIFVETISNPTLRVADLGGLAEVARQHQARLLVDNTFATPVLCRPLRHGASLVLESASKMMNGHSDVMLGLLCGNSECWERVPLVTSAWGLAASPFDCWLGSRGLSTLALRMRQACGSAKAVAEMLAEHPGVSEVMYPGLAGHQDHALAQAYLDCELGFGSIVTWTLHGGRAAADAFIQGASHVPFCPSLGEISTTISHPMSTSHRGLTPQAQAELGIDGGTLRLSVGCESTDWVVEAVREGLAAAERSASPSA